MLVDKPKRKHKKLSDREKPIEILPDGSKVYGRNIKGKIICNSLLANKPGRRCQSVWVMKNGRCIVHNGRCAEGPLHPAWKNGNRSPYATALSEYDAQRFEAFRNADDLLSVADDIAFTNLRISKLGEDLNALPEGFVKMLQRSAESVRLDAEHNRPKAALRQALYICDLIDKLANGVMTYQQIERLQEHKRKLAETETKKVFGERNSVPLMKLQVFLGRLVQAIKSRADDCFPDNDPKLSEAKRRFFGLISEDFRNFRVFVPNQPQLVEKGDNE